ncbi:MAG TPA: DUF4214 domain-containing protein [Gemmataceae bacterium]|jgi:sugar lactone lactonase YvrE|nr:DUF4214 domain-containing protein [Gemmataceae bacterium]
MFSMLAYRFCAHFQAMWAPSKSGRVPSRRSQWPASGRCRLEELEARLAPATVQFNAPSETISATAGSFSIGATVSGAVQPTISAFASGFNSPYGMAVDSAGNLYVANEGGSTVSKLTPAGVVSTFASGFGGPIALAFDAAGNLYVANYGFNSISEVTPGGTVSTFASNINNPSALAFDAAGNLYVANEGNTGQPQTVTKITPAGVTSIFASGFIYPDALAFDAAGNLYVGNETEANVGVVNEVTPAGVVSTFASGFTLPSSAGYLAFDGAGNLYVGSGGGNTVSKVTPAGVVSTFASGFSNPSGLAFDGGNLYVANAGANTVSEVDGSVSVPFTLGGTAIPGADYSGVTASPLVIPTGETSGTITGTLISDLGLSKTLTFTLGTPSGASLGSPTVNSLTIAESTTLSFTSAATGAYGGMTSLEATLTSGTTPLANETVDFTFNGTNEGSATTDANGVAMLSVSLGALDAATYDGYVGASFGGGGAYDASSATTDLTITPAKQTITWTNPTDLLVGTPLGAAQLDATVSVAGPAPAGTLTYTPLAGTVFATGNDQTLSVAVAATADYQAASARVSINVTTAPSVTGVSFATTEGESFTGTVATFTYSNSTAPPAEFNCSINWGDNQTSAGTVSANGTGGFVVTASHTYTNEGRYTVQATITAPNGANGSATSLAHVARTGNPPTLLGTVAQQLVQSAEYYSDFVTTAYQNYLGRTPDSSGLNYWVTQMQSGLTDEHLEAGFIGSSEYIANHGGSNQAWIIGMYQNLLNRTPSETEVDYWLSQLAEGESPSAVAYGFAASAEREGDRVMADYQQYLGRAASQTEVDYWVNQFVDNHLTNEQVIEGFIGSAEYFKDHYDNAGDWIFSAYQDVLQRQPDEASYAHWLQVLEQS